MNHKVEVKNSCCFSSCGLRTFGEFLIETADVLVGMFLPLDTAPRLPRQINTTKLLLATQQTITMAGKYELLCLENPLLGEPTTQNGVSTML